MAVIEAIATQYVEADVASVTFSSIPSTYEHLQVHGSHRATGASGGQAFYIEFNGVSSNTYASHTMVGANATGLGQRLDSQPYIKIYDGIHGGFGYALENEYATILLDVQDYRDTNKNTTVQFQMFDAMTYGTDSRATFGSGMWESTAAVTQIKFTPSNGNLMRGSEYTLYGLKSS